MRLILPSIVLSLALGAGVATAEPEVGEKPSDKNTAAVKAEAKQEKPAVAEWQQYTNAALGFGVKLPYKPATKQQLLDSSKENKLADVKHLEISSANGDTRVLISVSQFGAEMPTGSKIIEFAYTELKRSLESHGDIEYDRNISGKDYVGHEMRVETKEKHYLYVRIIAAGSNLIVVNIDAKANEQFDSFMRKIFNSMTWR